MDFENAVKLLQLENNFTPEQVKQNYHRLSLKFHPDKGGNPDDFVNITKAYEFLTKQSEQTNEYTQPTVINLNDIFRTFISPSLKNLQKAFTKDSTFFGETKKEVTVTITPKEFLEGVTKEIEQPYKMHCGCQPRFCDRCRGFSLNCSVCNCSGIVFCGKCVNGYTLHSRTISITIPKNSLKTILFENMIINIELEKKRKKKKTIENAFCFYFVKENKLYYNYPITLKESLVGFTKTFKDCFENQHTIISNNIIKQNDGYRILDNLFLLFEIIYPTKLNKSVINQLKQIEF